MNGNISNFKLNDSVTTYSIELGAPSNVIIEGDFGGGTVEHTLTGSVTPVRTPSSAAETYRSLVENATFTLVGASGADISIIIETVKIR